MRPSAASGIVPFLGFDRDRAEPYYSQIYAGFRAAILEGRLRPGQRIPSSRALAQELGISRLPVLNALEQLVHEGFIEGRAGAGSFVSASIPSGKPVRKRSRRPRPAPAPDGLDGAAPRGLSGAFRVSLPALDQFPLRAWARLVARHARQMPPELMAYGEPAGHLPLRRAIADYLSTAAAVRCEPGQVLIVAGSQMALQLCARVLLGPGDEAFVEEPGYPGARKALAATGAALRPRRPRGHAASAGARHQIHRALHRLRGTGVAARPGAGLRRRRRLPHRTRGRGARRRDPGIRADADGLRDDDLSSSQPWNRDRSDSAPDRRP